MTPENLEFDTVVAEKEDGRPQRLANDLMLDFPVIDWVGSQFLFSFVEVG